MKVYLFRHGQTPGNAAHRYLGITDEPLSELGMETARMTGSDLTVGEVLVSPLKRTQMTAAILFPNAKQRVCDSFRPGDGERCRFPILGGENPVHGPLPPR